MAVTVSVIGSKWKLLILQLLSTRGLRFNELLAALPGISKKMLSTALRALNADGIIIREVHPTSPISVVYKLSAMGESLQPVLDAMSAWGEHYRAWRLEAGQQRRETGH